jgi:hypothetical protein
MSNLTQFTTGGVKSIQFGVNAGAYDTNVVVSISTINPAKSVVILSPGGYTYVNSQANAYTTCRLIALTSSSFTAYGPFYYYNGTYAFPFSWQVIEYY